MSAKKKNQPHPGLQKFRTVWSRYPLWIFAGMVLLFLAISGMWHRTDNRSAAREIIENFAAGNGAASFEILSVSEDRAVLKMVADDLELEEVVLEYSPDHIAAGLVRGVTIGRVRIKGDFLTGCRKLFRLKNHPVLHLTGTVTIREIVWGEQVFRNLILPLDTLNGTLDGNTEISYDVGKKLLQLKKNVLFTPQMCFAETEWKRIPEQLRRNLFPLSAAIRVQELVLDLTENTHSFKRIAKLQAENVPDAYQTPDGLLRTIQTLRYDAGAASLEMVTQDSDLKYSLKAAPDVASGEVTFREERNTTDGSKYSYEGKIGKTGHVAGKGFAGRKGTAADDFQEETVEFFDDWAWKKTRKQYRNVSDGFVFSAPVFVTEYNGKNENLSFRNAEIVFTGTPFAAKDFSGEIKENKAGTFTFGSVLENGRKTGSISGSFSNGDQFVGKGNLYGLDGVVQGKIGADDSVTFLFDFPRQQIRNAGRDLLPLNSPAHLQGFIAMQVKNDGIKDFVIDNGELDLSPLKLGNFRLDSRKQTFSFDNATFAGLTFGAGQGRYRQENGVVRIEGAQFDWCGGKCTLMPQMDAGKYLLDCTDLKLAGLFRELKIGTFTGNGTLSGKFYLTVAEDGSLMLDHATLNSAPGDHAALQGELNNTYNSESGDYAFVMQVIRNMTYDWVRLDFQPAENGVDLKIAFRGKPAEPLPYELVRGSNGGMMIRKSDKTTRFGSLNLELKIGDLKMDPVSGMFRFLIP